jgi:hypothetical protein
MLSDPDESSPQDDPRRNKDDSFDFIDDSDAESEDLAEPPNPSQKRNVTPNQCEKFTIEFLRQLQIHESVSISAFCENQGCDRRLMSYIIATLTYLNVAKMKDRDTAYLNARERLNPPICLVEIEKEISKAAFEDQRLKLASTKA